MAVNAALAGFAETTLPGAIQGNRWKGSDFLTASEKRAKAVALAKSRLKKNKYTNGSNRGYVWGKPAGTDPGYSDCSSFVRAVIKKASGIDIGGNTGAQIDNCAKGEIIEDNRDGARAYPTLSKLLPGDCIYYKGNKNYTWRVGHVEMVLSKTKCIGHGSDIGPKIKDTKSYSKSRTGDRRYLCVIRWIKDDADEEPSPIMPTPEDDTGKLLVGCDRMNIRKGPGTSYGIVEVVKRGDKLTPVESTGWVPVLWDGLVRWASRKYLEEVK